MPMNGDPKNNALIGNNTSRNGDRRSMIKAGFYSYFPHCAIVFCVAYFFVVPFILRASEYTRESYTPFDLYTEFLFQTRNDRSFFEEVFAPIAVLLLIIVVIRFFYDMIMVLLSRKKRAYDYARDAALMIVIIGAVSAVSGITITVISRVGITEETGGFYIIDYFINYYIASYDAAFAMIVIGFGLRYVLLALRNNYDRVVNADLRVPQSGEVKAPNTGVCANCQALNPRTRSTCYKCGKSLSEASSAEMSLKWRCKYCAHDNPVPKEYCFFCKRKREET